MVPVLALLLAAAPELPDLAPSVRGVFPLGGRAGETVEVRISGRQLADTQEIAFARPDLRAEVLASDFFAVTARVTVGPAVPNGLHDYRLRTPRGTYVGVFHVTSLPSRREKEPNNDPEHAEALDLPVLIDGQAGGGDYDLFRFHAEAGQTLTFDLTATRASSRLDAALALLDDRGNELDFVDDSYIHKDPLLVFPVRATGDYFLRVASSGERGSRDAGAPGYRLAAGATPHPLRVLPLGARRGVTATHTLYGYNLASVDRLVLGDSLATGRVVAATASTVTFELAVPAGAPLGPHPLRAFAAGREAPLAIPLVLSDLDERLSTPARTRAQPQVVRPPVALSGVLDRRRAADFFALDVQAGQRFTFRVDAMQLGYLVDPLLVVYTEAGELVASEDDWLQQNGDQPPNLDPYLVHTFAKSGRYIVMLRDNAQRGDPNYAYRLSIFAAEPDFELRTLAPEITLYRGQTGRFTARVRRLNGWDTPVEVWAENLPSGVTSEPRTAEPKPSIRKDNCALERRMDGTDVEIPLRVAPDAALGAFPICLRARGVLGGRTVEHTEEVHFRWESVGKVTGPTADQKLVATVTELPPVLLDPPESLTLTPGKTARLRVLVKRYDGGSSPLTIEPATPLEGVQWTHNVLQPGAIQVEIRLTASQPLKADSIRLQAGQALSPPIRISAREEQP
jgi:hypothetical protein